MDLDPLFDLLRTRGFGRYDGEDVTQLDHALQSAWAAEQEGATPALVIAALFHDVGHLLHGLGEDASARGIDDRHEVAGAAFLARWFGPDVTRPVGLHVEAKRYLCTAEPGYAARLSPESVRSLALQGGPHDEAQAAAFVALPQARDALALRRWDEAAKVVGLVTPPPDHFRAAAAAVRA